jgi:hypothetical protein
MIARYGLFPTPYERIANWAFVDFILNFPEETILSKRTSSESINRFFMIIQCSFHTRP